MQLPTSLFYDRMSGRMSSLNAAANRLQTQIATGKKLVSPSDDPAAAQQIAEFNRRDADATVYQTNITLSASLLKQADSTLDSIGEQIQRAAELATQAGNGTYGTGTLKTMGEELKAILSGLVGLANGDDSRGQPLFGSASGTPAVIQLANGTFSYNQAPSLSPIPIGDGQTVEATETASRVFGYAGGDTLSAIATLADALTAGTATPAGIGSAIDALGKAGEQVSLVRASVGARAARVDLQQSLLTSANADRAEIRSSIEDVDVSEAIVELQKTMTVLQATQASFSKLSQLSLFDYIR